MGLDITKMAVVGRGAGAKVLDCTERKCEGCKRRVYLSKVLLRDAVRRAGPTGICIVCWACTRPWIDDIARNGGEVAGETGVIETDFIPLMNECRREQTEAN